MSKSTHKRRSEAPPKVRTSDIRPVASVLTEIADPAVMRRFMKELLTTAELRDLVLRWRLLQRLHAGEPQRRIADDLGVSLCKITRGSRILKRKGSVTAAILDRQAAARKRTTTGNQQPARHP